MVGDDLSSFGRERRGSRGRQNTSRVVDVDWFDRGSSELARTWERVIGVGEVVR